MMNFTLTLDLVFKIFVNFIKKPSILGRFLNQYPDSENKPLQFEKIHYFLSII